MPTDDFISCDFPNLDAFIKQLDLTKENVNKALRAAMYESGKMIEQEQKRCILGAAYQKKEKKKGGGTLGERLAPHISVGKIFSTKKGVLGISSGYQDDAFAADSKGVKPGVLGMIWEFGRPGKSSSYRSNENMKQKRNGKRVTVKKGTIQPVPHIRRGFDNVKNRAAQTVIEAYNREIDKLGDNK